MAKKLSLQEVLDHITDQENSGSIAGIEEETTEDESYSEDALQHILEEENITEQAENLPTTEEEQSSDFEGPAEVDVTFWSKDGNLSWSSSPTEIKRQIIHRKCHKDDTRVDKICHIPHWRHKIMLQPVSDRAYWKQSYPWLIWREECVPVAQWLEHCVSSAKVVGSIPILTYWQKNV